MNTKTKTEQAKHTPGPLYSIRPMTDLPDADGYITIKVKPGLFTVFKQGETTDRVHWAVADLCNEDEAKTVAVALNSHDELLAAAQLLLVEFTGELPLELRSTHPAILQARAAIAKATGGQE